MVSPKLALVCLLAFVAVVSAGKNDLIIGHRVYGDRPIQTESIVMDASKIGRIVTITKTFSGNGYSTITQVQAIDRNASGHGAKVSLVAGGEGNKFVTLKFESERFRGIDFFVEIFGH